MNHALFQNIAVLLVIAFGLALTKNPLFILGLLLMVEMPYGLHPSQTQLRQTQAVGQDDDDFPPQPVGFTQDVK